MKGVGKDSSQKLTDLGMREKSEILAGVQITPMERSSWTCMNASRWKPPDATARGRSW
jgi:hypothetical protein